MEKYNDLTNKQKDILIFIKKFIATNKYPPSIREICKGINLKSPATVHVHINNLIEKGYLKRSYTGNHSLELLTANEFESSDFINIPIINNKINKNNIIDVINSATEFIKFSKDLINDKNTYFIIKSNDKISNIEINDYLIIELSNKLNNDDIVAILNEENKVILKIYTKENGLINLEPTNNTKLNKYTIIGKVYLSYRLY